MDSIKLFISKILEYIWYGILIIGTLCAIYFGFQDHPWITTFFLIISVLGFGFIFMVFKAWGDSEETIAKDIRDRYGEREPHEGSFFLFKCKPLMSMVEKSTSEKILGFKVPEYEITDAYGMPPNFNGDYMEVVEFKFKEPLSSEIMEELERKSKESKSRWKKDKDGYILTLDEVDLENRNDHYHSVYISSVEMTVTEGRV